MTNTEMTVLKNIESGDYSETSALRDQDFIALATAIDGLISKGLVVQEDGEYFPTAAGVRAIWA